jgi:hypothetical protein
MLLLWKIRYLDSHERQFKDRCLWLETGTLDPALRAMVELCHQLGTFSDNRCLLKFRQLFCLMDITSEDWKVLSARATSMSTVLVHGYYEDEDGQELSRERIAEIVTGSTKSILVSPRARQHDIDFMLAANRPVPVDQITLSKDDLETLGYFVRDLREMLATAFYTDGPGTLTSQGSASPELQTASTDEEIRSFVTIFRRLYMKTEPAGILKAVEVFVRITQGLPIGSWVAGERDEYERKLKQRPSWIPFVDQSQLSFDRKRLIDIFIYTRYAHQPCTARTRQYKECLALVGGRSGVLYWLFLTAMRECSLNIRNAGVIIAQFFDRYCQVHRVSADILRSVAHDHPGIGQLENEEDRRRRLLEEKASQLAQEIWESKGKPPNGPASFMNHARKILRSVLGIDCNSESES